MSLKYSFYVHVHVHLQLCKNSTYAMWSNFQVKKPLIQSISWNMSSKVLFTFLCGQGYRFPGGGVRSAGLPDRELPLPPKSSRPPLHHSSVCGQTTGTHPKRQVRGQDQTAWYAQQCTKTVHLMLVIWA